MPLSREYLFRGCARRAGNINIGSSFAGGLVGTCHPEGSFASLGEIDFRISRFAGGGLERSGVTITS
jgi:hypothetical protein